MKQKATTTSFKELVVESSSEGIQFQPRDKYQCNYYKSIVNPHRKLGSDAIVTVSELAYSIPDYVWSIGIFPDLVISFGIPSLMKMVQTSDSILLSYDTTFLLGDFYLSVLVLKLSAFCEAPIIPIGFVLHDRKFQAVHASFCEQLRPRLKVAGNVVLVTDGELAITSAFKEAYPKWRMVNCWNHILTDVESWLKRHDGKASDIAIYKSNVRELLQCESAGELGTKMSTLEPLWSQSFQTYYNNHLVKRVETAYTGHLLSIGLQVKSITTNMSESVNYVIKEFQGWKESTGDICLLSLYRLHLYYQSVILRSADGFGPYTLRTVNDAGE